MPRHGTPNPNWLTSGSDYVVEHWLAAYAVLYLTCPRQGPARAALNDRGANYRELAHCLCRDTITVTTAGG